MSSRLREEHLLEGSVASRVMRDPVLAAAPQDAAVQTAGATDQGRSSVVA
jgi:hypothetical protein